MGCIPGDADVIRDAPAAGYDCGKFQRLSSTFPLKSRTPLYLGGKTAGTSPGSANADNEHSCADFLFTNPECGLYPGKSGAFKFPINPLEILVV